jgi:hypothetical protein
MNVRQFFTPVIGNEVTTEVGHFIAFPIRHGAEVPDHRKKDWPSVLDQIEKTPGVRIIILNHPRDVHTGVRPFGPLRYNWLVAENRDAWPLRFQGVEVINSSAIQNDCLQPFLDWMALLNRGYSVTPVGSSDSHDVARHFVGQGRTYIRCDDHDPGRIDIQQAVESFLNGSVLVSYGLLAELVVDGQYRSGDLVPAPANDIHVALRVLGPHWTSATHVTLFANGIKVREAEITERAADRAAGVIWQDQWTLPRPKHDVHLVALAQGPGIDQVYWKTAKPYQPVSMHVDPHVLGCSGAVWIDADGDGRRTSAREYAERVYKHAAGKLDALIGELKDYDESVAAHAAHVYGAEFGTLTVPHDALADATDAVRAGFQAYLHAWREHQGAQVGAE